MKTKMFFMMSIAAVLTLNASASIEFQRVSQSDNNELYGSNSQINEQQPAMQSIGLSAQSQNVAQSRANSQIRVRQSLPASVPIGNVNEDNEDSEERSRGRSCCNPIFTLNIWDPLKHGLLILLAFHTVWQTSILNDISTQVKSHSVGNQLHNINNGVTQESKLLHNDLQAILHQMKTSQSSALSYALPAGPKQVSMSEANFVTPQFAKPIGKLQRTIKQLKLDKKNN